MATFGGSALEALAKAPKSQPPVPQAATGYWNLDGATDVKKGGQLTKTVVALECEARGLPVKRWAAGTKNAGEGVERRERPLEEGDGRRRRT